MRPFEAVICGYYGMGNLGDELLLRSMIDLFAAMGVGTEKLVVLSGNPCETAKRYGVKTVNRWSLIDIWRACRSSRTFLLGGGGLFQDSTSVRSVLYYGLLLVLSSFSGCRAWVFGNSLGPLSSVEGRFFAGLSLKVARVVALRDKTSMSVAEGMGIKSILCPDPVTSLQLPLSSGSSVLINLRPWDGVLEHRVAGKLGTLLKRDPRRVVGVAMAPEDGRLMAELGEKGVLPLDRVVYPKDAGDPIWRSGEVAFGMRLHFCVLASLAGISGVAIPYDPKVFDFARSVGYPSWLGEGAPPKPSRPDGKWLDRCNEASLSVFKRCWEEVCR